MVVEGSRAAFQREVGMRQTLICFGNRCTIASPLLYRQTGLPNSGLQTVGEMFQMVGLACY